MKCPREHCGGSIVAQRNGLGFRIAESYVCILCCRELPSKQLAEPIPAPRMHSQSRFRTRGPSHAGANLD